MTEPARREPIVGRATDEAQLATRRALVVQFRAGSEPTQRRLVASVEHVLRGRATPFSPSTIRSPSSSACSPSSMSGGTTVPAPQRHADLQAWIQEHADADLSVDGLARRIATRPRNVLRVFVRMVGMTSERSVECVRVEVARRLPEEASRGVPDVGTARGHKSRAPPGLAGTACQPQLAHSRPR